ncbi:TldD/PmbA family protein [Nostocoides sp. Soil756]|uniref:TldD/PmbA family protein n=1 Tax=Nostocoides sp. Soil756 TaxID=1736399 RepID=UPI0006F40DD8|nr:TldD/PmbA family protein [Tetrasphaera sp. Soil756]KRE60795.1 peptidase U62 [Tetrasphaera sp. Soil756]
MSTSAASPPTAHDWGDLADDVRASRLMEEALAATEVAGLSFADVRLVEAEELRLYTARSGDLDERSEHSAGIGVRVLLDGAWGFAAVPLSGPAAPGDGAPRQAAEHAVRSARAGSGLARAELPPRAPSSGRWEVPVELDPFAVRDEERHLLLQEVVRAASAPHAVRSVTAGLNAKRQHKHYADSEGSRQHQHLVESGAVLQATAVDASGVQRRSYPNSFHGNTAAGGWEYVTGLSLPSEAARVGEEAAQLLTAPHAPAGTASVVIGPAQMALQIHESVGHAIELDRILGDETNFAGTSWVQPADIGSLRYGSPAVTIVADPTLPGTRGTFAWDDEGTPAVRRTLVGEGVLREVLSSRESAARHGRETSGAARSDGWAYLPVPFATNVYLEPGTGSLPELLDRMGDGYYVDDNRSWSIDDRRLAFQFGTEVAWEVRRGRRGRLLRGFSYGGMTPQFWGSVEAVAGPEEFRSFGMPCGKGEPKQWGFLGHGAAPTLVRSVRIGVMG